MEKLKYLYERIYPYLIPAIVTCLFIRYEVNFVHSESLNSALDACNTVIALIIGFLGAILPVILGMKNESKIVKYIFESDKNRLFLKYIKATIFSGLVTLLITISLYFINDIIEFPKIQTWGFYIWEYMLLNFVLLTYRSLRSMLDLIFISDRDLMISRYNKENDYDKIKEKFNEDV